MNTRRAARSAEALRPDEQGNAWWLVHPALEHPRLVSHPGDTVIQAADERADYRELGRTEQHALLEALWTRVATWAETTGASGATAEPMDPSARLALVDAGFVQRERLTDGESLVRIGSWQLADATTAATLVPVFQIPALYLCVYSPERDLIVIFDSSWDAILVSARDAPVELLS